jgi:hypothetical protein
MSSAFDHHVAIFFWALIRFGESDCTSSIGTGGDHWEGEQVGVMRPLGKRAGGSHETIGKASRWESQDMTWPMPVKARSEDGND